MKRLLSLIAALLGGAFGWWLGSLIGFMTGFFLSILGTGVGMYIGNRLVRHWLL